MTETTIVICDFRGEGKDFSDNTSWCNRKIGSPNYGKCGQPDNKVEQEGGICSLALHYAVQKLRRQGVNNGNRYTVVSYHDGDMATITNSVGQNVKVRSGLVSSDLLSRYTDE